MIADKSVPALFKSVLDLDKKNHYIEPIVYPLSHAFYNISIYLITLMAFERYMCVCWPQKSKSIVTLKKTKIYIICCVFVGLIFTIPRFFQYKYEFNEESQSYEVLDTYKTIGESYKLYYLNWSHMIYRLIIPTISLAFFNISIFREVCKIISGEKPKPTKSQL